MMINESSARESGYLLTIIENTGIGTLSLSQLIDWSKVPRITSLGLASSAANIKTLIFLRILPTYTPTLNNIFYLNKVI